MGLYHRMRLYVILPAAYLPPCGAFAARLAGAPVWAALMTLVLGEWTRRALLAGETGAGDGC